MFSTSRQISKRGATSSAEDPAIPHPIGVTRNLFSGCAHARDYEKALNEIRSGQKTSHWIWYIFPQQKGLGYSVNSNYYGLEGIDEARAFLDHPILGEHLREISNALLLHAGKKDIDTIMRKHIDVTKLQTCMNLFNRVSPDDVFKKVLDAFF